MAEGQEPQPPPRPMARQSNREHGRASLVHSSAGGQEDPIRDMSTTGLETVRPKTALPNCALASISGGASARRLPHGTLTRKQSPRPEKRFQIIPLRDSPRRSRPGPQARPRSFHRIVAGPAQFCAGSRPPAAHGGSFEDLLHVASCIATGRGEGSRLDLAGRLP